MLAAIYLHLDMKRYFYTAWCRLRKGLSEYHQARQGTWQVDDKDDEEYWAKQTSLRHSGATDSPNKNDFIKTYTKRMIL